MYLKKYNKFTGITFELDGGSGLDGRDQLVYPSSPTFEQCIRLSHNKKDSLQVCSLFATLFSHLAELITTESQTKVWNVRGMFTPSRLCWNLSLSFKFFRLLGHVTPSRLWLNHWPNCKFSRLSGKITWSKLQSKRPPKDRLWRLLGKVTPSRHRLNSSPKVKLWRLAGKVTCWRHWLNI